MTDDVSWGDNDRLFFSFRIIGLDRALEYYVSKKCGGLKEYHCRPYYDDKTLLAVSCHLNEKTDLSLLLEVLKNCENKYLKADIFMSISSAMDTNIIDIPNFVVQAIKELPIALTLSYTIIPDE